MVIDVDRIQSLEALTEAAFKAKVMRLVLQDAEILTADVPTEERLRRLGKALGEVCALSGEGMPAEKLSAALLELSALAAIWAEVADKTHASAQWNMQVEEATAAFHPVPENYAQRDRIMRMGVNHQHRQTEPCSGYKHSYTNGGDTWLG